MSKATAGLPIWTEAAALEEVNPLPHAVSTTENHVL